MTAPKNVFDYINFRRTEGASYRLRDRQRSLEPQELLAAISRLTATLSEQGVRKQERVAVICERDITPVIAMLSLWRLGAVYVPISALNPQNRVEYILDNCGIEKVIILDESSAKKFQFGNRKLIYAASCLDGQATSSDQTLQLGATADEIAYILYTSGTTGNPKGVVIRHESVNSLLSFAFSGFPELGSQEIFMQTLEFSFDVSVWDILLWCTRGGTLFISDAGRRGRQTSANLYL
jgi:non-ribosomal peptide synthetase component F